MDGKELVRRAEEGSEKDFALLYDHLAPKIYSLLTLMLQDEREAQELLCEIFVQIWQKIPHYDATSGSLLGYPARAPQSSGPIAHERPAEKTPFFRPAPKFTGSFAGSKSQCQDRPCRSILPSTAEMSLTEISGRFGEPVGIVRVRLGRGLRCAVTTLAPRA